MNLRTEIADFLGPEIAARDVKYKGKTKKFYFKDLGGDDTERLFNNKDGKGGYRSRIISTIVCLEDGRPAFTPEEAASLPNGFQNALIPHCFDVVGINVKADADSEAPTPAEVEAGNEPSA